MPDPPLDRPSMKVCALIFRQVRQQHDDLLRDGLMVGDRVDRTCVRVRLAEMAVRAQDELVGQRWTQATRDRYDAA